MKYTRGWKYKTEALEQYLIPEMVEAHIYHEPYIYLENGTIEIHDQYAWNGASFILFKWFGTPDSWMVPSLVHDALYQLMRESKLNDTHRPTVDGIFYRLLRERGVNWLVATTAFWAVRVFGNYAMRHGSRIREVR